MANPVCEADCPEGMRWYLQALRANTVDEAGLARAYARHRFGLEVAKASLLQRREIFGAFVPETIEALDDGLFVLAGADGRGRASTLRIRLDPEAPHLIRSLAIHLTPPPGYTSRRGGPADYAACARVEAATPIDSDEGSYLTSRGDEFAAYLDLQGPAKLWVIECGGKIVGWTASALRTLKHPRPMVLGYAAQAFLLPAHRASRAFMQASALLQTAMQEEADAAFYFMNVGNDRSQNFNRGRQYWSVPVCDLSIPTDAAAGVAAETATEDDLPRIAALINAAHGGEALFEAYDADTLRDRFSRCPQAYGVGQVLLGGRAALGVCLARETIDHTAADGEVRRSVVASVLDYGFEGAAGLRELGELIMTASASARARGVTHLSLLCDPSSATYEALAGRADAIDHYLMSCMSPEPPDLVASGLYADHIYF